MISVDESIGEMARCHVDDSAQIGPATSNRCGTGMIVTDDLQLIENVSPFPSENTRWERVKSAIAIDFANNFR